MEKHQKGHIINVASIAGHRIGFAGAVYSSTKFAVRAITEGLRQELSPTSNIKTTIISPGTVETELRNTITDDDAREMLKNRISEQKKSLESVNIAEAIIFAIEQPSHVSINEMIIRPVTQTN